MKSCSPTPLAALALVAALALPPCAVGEGWLNAGPVKQRVKVTSWKELRDRGVVRQDFDFSCGAASLATLLTHYFGLDASEADVLEHLDVGDFAASFADLKQAAESAYGLRAIGLAADFDALLNLRVPVIVFLNARGSPHFSVLRGIDAKGHIWLADPSLGNRIYPRERFIEMWNTEQQEADAGKILVVLPPKDGGAVEINPGFFVTTELQARMRDFDRLP